ncbi:hypothetical protein [Nitrosopumilus sp.]|uniref:hypothetical protein n=1 Tax=Nitrosopumilus sp. TaxID=2024843 RepID=UPI00349FDDFB
MKTKPVIIIGIIVIIAISTTYVSLAYNQEIKLATGMITSDENPQPQKILPDPICFVVDRETSGETESGVTLDTCISLKQFEEMGCTKPMLEHLSRHSNILDFESDGGYYLDFIGLPDGMSKEKFEECWNVILEKRATGELENKTDSGSYELDEALCMGGRGMIKNDKCQRIGKYDIQTGIPIVENKVQCDLLNGTWYDDKKLCDSKYAPMEYRFQFGYSFLGYDVPQICTYDMMIHLARHSSMFENGAEYGIEDIGFGFPQSEFDICVDELLELLEEKNEN